MADFAPVEWNGVRIEGHALGWRGLLVLRKWLHKLPVFSGSRAHFCIHVKATDPERAKNKITISWMYVGPGQSDDRTPTAVVESLAKPFKFHAQTEYMMGPGTAQIRASSIKLEEGHEKGQIKGYTDLVTLDVKSSETLALWLLGILATGLMVLGAAWYGARVDRTLTIEGPIPVVVVEETPAPPSAPTGGNQ